MTDEFECTECGKTLKKRKDIWLELVEGTNDFFKKGIPKGEKSQGWFPFGSTCAKKVRRD